MTGSDVGAVSAWLASQALPTGMHALPAGAQREPLPGWCVLGRNGVNP